MSAFKNLYVKNCHFFSYDEPNYISFEKHLKKENYSFCSIDLMIMCEASTKFSAIIKFYFLKFITLIGVIDRRYNLNLLINPLRIIGKNLLLREVRKPKFIFHSTGKAGLKNGLYDFNYFKIDGFIKFENLNLLNYKGIKEYLKKRYGDSFMQLPSENVKRKYKSHTSGFTQFKDIKFLIDGVGVLWKMNEFKKGLLVKNKNIDNFLSCINTQVIICTNIPYKLNNANFEIYTTEQKFSKLEDEYFTKLISDFKLKKDKVIYVEHSKKVCKFASKYFEVINWDESKDSVDSFYFDLLKTINKKVVYKYE